MRGTNGIGRGIASAALTAYEEAFVDADRDRDGDFIRQLVPYVLGRHR